MMNKEELDAETGDLSDVVSLYHSILKERVNHLLSVDEEPSHSVSPSSSSVPYDNDDRMSVEDYVAHIIAGSMCRPQGPLPQASTCLQRSKQENEPCRDNDHCGGLMIMSSTKRFPKLNNAGDPHVLTKRKSDSDTSTDNSSCKRPRTDSTMGLESPQR